MIVGRIFSSLAIGAVILASGCASQPVPEAYDNPVFYEYGPGADIDLTKYLESPHPELDTSSRAGRDHMGVEILQGVARFSRPPDWVIRRGAIRPEERFIEYVSPRQVVFTVYERLEKPKDTWSTILRRYEADTEKQGGVFLGKSVPVATFDSQARAYDVRRGIPAGKEPFVSYSREYVARSQNRIVLIQMVRPRADYGSAEDELLQVIETLRVL